MKNKAIIFDLDRTLLNLSIAEQEGLKHLLNNLSIEIDFDHFYAVYSIVNESWWNKRSLGEADSNEVKANRFRDTFIKLDLPQQDDYMEINKIYFGYACEFWQLYPHVDSVLKNLQAKEFTMAIITNGFTETQNKKLDHLNIRPFFEYICLSESVQMTKPDPKIFQHTLEKININAADAVYIGDDFQTDVIGASDAGLKAIWYNEGGIHMQHDFPEFSDFQQFEKIIDQIF